MEESAAWCYERAELFAKAAEIYEKLAAEKGDAYYWKEAYELYRKAGELRKAAECLEKYAEEEPWFWEDVAKIYEEAGDLESSRKAWQRLLTTTSRRLKKRAFSGKTWPKFTKSSVILKRQGKRC